MTKRRIAALLAAWVMVAAVLPTGALATANPAAGIAADWTVTRPDLTERTDGTIAVGDDLFVRFRAVDETPITACMVRLNATGGDSMLAQGKVVDGACQLTIRIPEFPDPVARTRLPADSVGLDLCVYPVWLEFADVQERSLRTEDHLEPGGRVCDSGAGDPTFTAKLDFLVEPGGTARAFVSDPQVVSWNPADWGTDMQPFAFGTSWHYEPPDWLQSCWGYLNGEWQTGIGAEDIEGCEPWNVRVPGVLPASVDWTGGSWTWGFGIVTKYWMPGSHELETISAQRTPFAASDTVFESDRKAVFPIDLASSRFVTVGEPWTPVFQVTGGLPETCTMTFYDQGTFPPTFTLHEGTLDAEARCRFEFPPMVAHEYHQYFVDLTWTDSVTDYGDFFGGNVSTIPVPEPPVIEPPAEEPTGETAIGVEPGEGNGLVVDLQVVPAPAATFAAASVADPACAGRAISSDLSNGGSIRRLDTICDLAPGQYVATATMIDVSGRASTSSRTFTVLSSAPVVANRAPAAASTGVPRNVRPTVTFDRAVIGVSAATIRLRDVTTSAWVPATVTYDPATHRATLRPMALLGAGRSYRLYVTTGVKNLGGTPAAPTSATFRVSSDATAPTFTRSPAAGSAAVSRSANVVLTFSEAVIGVGSRAIVLRDMMTGRHVPAVVTYDSATRRATLNPSITLLPDRRYTVRVVAGMTDAAGNPVGATAWSFTSGP